MNKEMQLFLDQMEQDLLKKLQSEELQQFGLIKRARINKNYVDVSNDIFQILLQIYEGTPIADIFKNN